MAEKKLKIGIIGVGILPRAILKAIRETKIQSFTLSVI